MTEHPMAAEEGALILERTGRVRLGYSDDSDDRTGSMRSFGKTLRAGAASSQKSGVRTVEDGQSAASLLDRSGVTSYTLEILQRTKIFSEKGLALANIEEILPSGAELMSLEATTFLPDGTSVVLEPNNAHLRGDTLRFVMPVARPGAVLAYKYKVFVEDVSTFETWAFQREAPTLHNELRVHVEAHTSLPFRFVSGNTGRHMKHYRERFRTVDGVSSGWLVWKLTDIPHVPVKQRPVAHLVFE